MNSSDTSHLRRLGLAVEIFLGHRRSPVVSDEALLARHPELVELLEPMLEAGDTLPDLVASPAVAARRIGDFEIVRELGRGGMGTVYEARERDLGRRVALKLLRADLTLQPRQIERFRREAAAAARLRHHGIAQIHRVGEVEGVHYIAMELVDGPSLAKVIEGIDARCGGNPRRAFDGVLGLGFTGGYVAEVCQLIARLADALHYAHEHGVLHRDVKPQNIVLPGDGRAVLVDFGLAKDVEAHSLSRTGDLAGTPHYMSPEQIAEGNKAVDRRADVHSLGVVLYELLTLRCPFEGATTHAVLHAIVHHDASGLRRRNPRVPVDLDTICQKAIEKDCDRRYATAADLAADLRRFMAHEPIAAQPLGAWTRSARWARRHRAAATALVLAFLLVVVAPTAFGLQVWSSREALAAEQRATAQQRDLARAALERSRQAMNELFTTFAEEDIAPVPQLEELRRRLLERAVPFHEEFLALAPDDDALAAAAVESRVRLGRVLQQLGRSDDALAQLDQAVAALTELRANGDSTRLAVLEAEARELRACVHQLGRDAAAMDAERAASVALYRMVFETADEVVDRGIAVAALSRALTASAKEAMLRVDQVEAAEQQLDEAARLWDEFEEAERDRPERLYDRASLLLSRGRLHVLAGEFALAGERFAQAERLAQRSHETAPERTATRRLLADLAMEIGRIAEVQDRDDAALVAFGRCLDLYRGLVRDFPRYPAFRHRLGNALHSQAIYHARRAEFAEAETVLLEAFALADAMVGENPESAPDVGLLCAVCDLLASVRQELPDPDLDAIDAGYARAIEVVRPLVEAQPEHVPLRVNLALALSNGGAFALDVGDLKRARTCLEEALIHQEFACAAEPHDPQSQRNLELLRRRIARLEVREGEQR